ncbi:MAG: hypothetical protein EOO46_01220 [Flavobacterium sp.]|nr:MAG: hypothetical protein EOO46_01220 [Flavobacterium sp.]
MVIDLEPEVIEQEVIKVLEEINEALEANAIIDENCRPGNFFKSHALVTAIDRIADVLEITIPLNCYIFFDKKTLTQLTIKEATLKLIKVGKNGKQQLKF